MPDNIKSNKRGFLAQAAIMAGAFTACTLLCFLLDYFKINDLNFLIIYILGILLTAVLTQGYVYSSVLSLLSVIGYNFFFTQPRYTLHFNDKSYLATFILMLVVGIGIGGVTYQLKKKMAQINTLNMEKARLRNEAEKEQMKATLLRSISHDLRTPLTIIKSYAEMIRDLSGDNPVKRQAHTQVIVDESDRLSGLVSDMLDLSKLESGTLKLNISRFDMAETVKEIINRFAVYQHRDGYVITSQCEEEAWVEADQLKISQVVYNLIGNAINYTGEDKTVHIAVHVQRGKVRFSVSDSGEGIPKEEIDRVWERYYKSSQRHKRAAVGTGIGLSIVKNILLLHHAEFGVNSKVHKGSTFWFSLNKADGMKEDALL